jgi:hypothetical protein
MNKLDDFVRELNCEELEMLIYKAKKELVGKTNPYSEAYLQAKIEFQRCHDKMFGKKIKRRFFK